MIWEEELEEEMGSRGTEGSEEDEGRKRKVNLNENSMKTAHIDENLHVNIASGQFPFSVPRQVDVHQYKINRPITDQAIIGKDKTGSIKCVFR